MSDQLNNPLTKAWFYHQQLSTFLYLSSTIFFERLLASSSLCSARGPFDVFILGECCVGCVAKKTRSQPPASTSTNEPEIMHHELSTTSARAPDKSYEEISEGILAAARFKHVTCIDCEVNLYKWKICESKFELPECQLIRLLRSGLIWLVKMLITNCSNIGGLVGLMVSWSTGWWWYGGPALLQWWAIVWKAVGLFVVGRIFDSVVPHTLRYPQFKPTFLGVAFYGWKQYSDLKLTAPGLKQVSPFLLPKMLSPTWKTFSFCKR